MMMVMMVIMTRMMTMYVVPGTWYVIMISDVLTWWYTAALHEYVPGTWYYVAAAAAAAKQYVCVYQVPCTRKHRVVF